jgi:hypothetical protein
MLTYIERGRFARRQASLQYFTVSQFLAHFLRHVNGRPQCAQGRLGRSDLATPRTAQTFEFASFARSSAAAPTIAARASGA